MLEGYDEIQIELMNEMCIVLDENDAVIGADTKKNCEVTLFGLGAAVCSSCGQAT